MKRLALLALILMGALAAPASAGQWAVECGFSHQGQYDPIRAPGQPGASHLHEFFGLRGVTSSISRAELQGALPADSTCLLGADRSSYWAPALYQGSKRIQPSSAFAYYLLRDGVEPYPLGMEIIGGDVEAKAPQEGIIAWYCDWDSTNAGPPQAPPPCGSIEPVDNPDGSTLRDQLRLEVRFPFCWSEGLAPSAVIYPESGRCPASNPRILPQLVLNVMYPVQYPGSNIRLASGSIISAHADFVNGWSEGTQRELIDRCLDRDCGRISDRGRREALRPSRPILEEQIRQLLQAGI